MTDRSAIMRAVRSKNTGPELAVRKLAWSIRRGYRLHRKELPGKPDLAYVGARKAIFVHGCFWHGHDCPRGARRPVENAGYWRAKIARNRERDARALAELARLGWRALVVWECELKNEAAAGETLRRFLDPPGDAAETSGDAPSPSAPAR